MQYVKSLDINTFDYEKIRKKMIKRKKELDSMMSLGEHTKQQHNLIRTISAIRRISKESSYLFVFKM